MNLAQILANVTKTELLEPDAAIEAAGWKGAVWRSLGFKPLGRCVNLACGPDIRPGWLNVDFFDPRADLLHDLREFPWPFPDQSVDTVTVEHYIEHLPFTDKRDLLDETMREIWRILRPGGEVLIATPYAGSRNDHWNHKHVRSFIPETLGFLWAMKGHEPTTQEYGPERFEHVRTRVRRNLTIGPIETNYHIPARLGIDLPWLGRPWEILWHLRKPVFT